MPVHFEESHSHALISLPQPKLAHGWNEMKYTNLFHNSVRVFFKSRFTLKAKLIETLDSRVPLGIK